MPPPEAKGTSVVRLPPGGGEDFLALHSEAHGAGWCRCVAWNVPTWEGWGERTAEENLALRREIAARGERDLWLLRVDGEPAASCQAGPRDRLPKLVGAFGLEPSPETWAITCFFVAPAHRRQGRAAELLAGLLEDLRALGVSRVEAYPKAGAALEDGEAWTGPERLFLDAGFELVKPGSPRSVMALELSAASKGPERSRSPR